MWKAGGDFLCVEFHLGSRVLSVQKEFMCVVVFLFGHVAKWLTCRKQTWGVGPTDPVAMLTGNDPCTP